MIRQLTIFFSKFFFGENISSEFGTHLNNHKLKIFFIHSFVSDDKGVILFSLRAEQSFTILVLLYPKVSSASAIVKRLSKQNPLKLKQ